MSGPGLEESEAPRCEECGAHEPHEFAGKWLCVDCLQIAGSSCAPGLDEE